MINNQKILLILILIGVFGLFCASNFVLAQEITDYPTISGADTPGPDTTLPQYIKYLFNFGIALGGILAFVVFAFGGVMWVMSAGNPVIIGIAKAKMLKGIMGLALLLASYLIIVAINPDLTVLTLEDLDWKEYTGRKYVPADIDAKTYKEMPIGLLIEDILAKNISCFDKDGNLINCRTQEIIQHAKEDIFAPDTHYNYCYKYDNRGNKKELMDYRDRMDCIKRLLVAIKIKSNELKQISKKLEIALKQCKCTNCDHGYCIDGFCNGRCKCIPCKNHCHCCGSPREERISCSGNPPFTLYTDPCPNRKEIDDIRNEIHQIINGTKKKIDGANIIDDPLHDTKFLYLKEAQERLNGLKQELNKDLDELKEVEELTKFPYGKRLSLAEYFDKKLKRNINKQMFKHFYIPEYDSISRYCKIFNCKDFDSDVCHGYRLNDKGILCNLFNFDGDPATFYYPKKEYE
ncbi:hypothetical protein KAW43_02765 [Candidatus Parcubacteria bacterium]|nr:hypothetical protein [Candidatus Parcubacteria bacterium]